jgi:CelD/BcsL family acetyltransferase involved in cellulose biosynthesis
MQHYPDMSFDLEFRPTQAVAPEAQGASHVEVVSDMAGFTSLRPEWNDLLQASDADSLFLTWEWLHTWWKHLAAGRKLQLLTVRRGSDLLAIAPFAVRPRQPERLLPFQALEFLGTGAVGSDYLDLIIRCGAEDEALQAIAGYLTENESVLELKQVRAGSRLASRLAVQLQKSGWAASQTITDVCPYLDINGRSWESYLAGVGPSHRQNVRRRLRRIAASFQVDFQQVRTEVQRWECLALFAELHRMRWAERRGSDALDGDGIMEFHDEFTTVALQRGWLRLFILRLDGKPAASIYAFRYGKAFYFYQSGFDPAYRDHSVGLVTMGLAIQVAIEEGAAEYDMLHGDEEYKFLWARGGRDLVRLDCYPPNLEGTLCRQAVSLRQGLKRAVRWPQRLMRTRA